MFPASEFTSQGGKLFDIGKIQRTIANTNDSLYLKDKSDYLEEENSKLPHDDSRAIFDRTSFAFCIYLSLFSIIFASTLVGGEDWRSFFLSTPNNVRSISISSQTNTISSNQNNREYMPSRSPTSGGASASEPGIQDSWPRNQDDNSSKILDFSGYQYVPETFEIVINFCSGKRAGMLKSLLKKYMLCNGVGIIHILNNCNMTMEWLRTGELYKGRVHIVEGPNVGPLSHRFWNHNWTKTHMWHQDDDMFYDCEEMTQAYRKILPRWNEMAGYSPHLQQCFSRTLKDLEFKNKILEHGEYDCIYLTKGGFIPTPVLDLYWNPRWDAIRAKVDELLTGEDLLFCAVITYEKLVQNMMLEWSALAMLQYDQSNLSKEKRVRRTRDQMPDQSRRLSDFTASLSKRSSGKRYIVYDMIREQMKRDLAGVDFSQMQQNKWRCVLSDFEISTISKCCPVNGNQACYRI